MNVVSKTGFGILALFALAAIVYAADWLTMKCNDKKCGYSTEVFFGGTMNDDAITGYCRGCNTFVQLTWPRKSNPPPKPKDVKGTDPEPIDKALDSKEPQPEPTKPKEAKGTDPKPTKIYEITDLFDTEPGPYQFKDVKAGGPKPIGTVWDCRTGSHLRIYACPNCKGPFAEITSMEHIVHCPDCNKKTFSRDKSKPWRSVD